MIVAATVKTTDGIIHTGRRHADIFKLLHGKHTESYFFNAEQGFINEHGEFLNRIEAAKEAVACGQVDPKKLRGRRLSSEDIY